MGIFDIDLRFDRQNWFETFSASLGTVFVRQIRFYKTIVKNREWDLNLKDGTITFGSVDRYKFQIIGKEDAAKGVWQWAFQDFTGVNTECLNLANSIKNAGEKFGNEALREPCFNIDETYNGDTLSIVACAIQTENYCYFKCDNSSGSMFIAITDLPDELFEEIDVEDMMNITLDRIKHTAVNQKIFLESLFQMNDTSYEWQSRVLLAADFGDRHFVIDFKSENGFLNISQMRIVDPKTLQQENQDTSE